VPRARRSRPPPAIEVLRIGHRAGRDPRLTTHLALAARAFGARRLWLHPADHALSSRIAAVTRRWGGRFEVVGVSDWRTPVRAHAGHVVHLTMYGEPMLRVLPRLRRRPELLVVVGGAKVPPELFRLADVNVAVGHQPHSEVAALAVLLDRLVGRMPPGTWDGATHVILPQARGKRVVLGRRTEP
jgi:tRNA (cytidine56-2'-O)-methyltransferase